LQVTRKIALNSLSRRAEEAGAVMKTKILTLLVMVISLGMTQVSLLAADGTEPPVPVRTVAPKFPDDMKRLGTSGLVTVSCMIDEKGNVSEPKIVKASNDAFAEPAMEALVKWKFKPAKKDGAAVAIRVNIPVQFNVD
jgi:protein TonB